MIGSVSHGTLQPRDLIPAFLSALEDACPDTHLTLSKRWEDLIQRAKATSWEQVCDDDDRCYCGEAEVDHLLDDLFQSLDAVAPEGTYFGATEGDGSDFGFWPVDEDEDEEEEDDAPGRQRTLLDALFSAYEVADSVEDAVRWALSDLRHICDAHDLAFHQADRDAYQLYLSERLS